MKPSDLRYTNLQSAVLSSYSDRAHTISAQFLRWFMEEIFRMDSQDADDACVDSQLDKGIDGIFISEQAETIYLFQSKIRQKTQSKLGDKDLKEFSGSLEQFRSADSINNLLEGNASDQLKNCIRRTDLVRCLESGFTIVGVFCTNISASRDAIDYLKSQESIELYDASRIADERIDIEVNGGISKQFKFDVSDTEVIEYESKDGVAARIFLANATDLVNLDGISDGKLFEQNVRLSLGNTKINKGLVASIKNVAEHKNFPLYHNGITLLCDQVKYANDDTISVKDYVVVNGAQSITSLHTAKSSITKELRVLTKVVAVKGDTTLAEKITYNSNNQNAIKARDLRSNHPIQARLKEEIRQINFNDYRYEVKRGEDNQGFSVISNEDAGLILLAIDLGEPWSCHQRYRVMDDSHSRIFGQPNVDGYKILTLYEFFRASLGGIKEIDDTPLARYNLTKYFLSYSVSRIIKTAEIGTSLLAEPKRLFDSDCFTEFIDVVADLSVTVGIDFNTEVDELLEQGNFDYKASLKNAGWCRDVARKLVSSYLKDVKRKKADPVEKLLSFVK